MSVPNDEPRWRRYLRFWRSDAAADVSVELRFHLESRVTENMAAGMSAAEARRAAVERFGDVHHVERSLASLTLARVTIERRVAWRQVIREDLRYAVRQLARSPAFTAVAVLTLALGIGANTAIFSAVYSVLLRPLPYQHADRLVDLREGTGQGGSMNVTMGNYDVWRQRSPQFSALAAYTYAAFTLTGAGAPQRLLGLSVSADYWRALYIPPLVGRYFSVGEDQPGAPNVVVLSYALWSTAFASDRRSRSAGRRTPWSASPPRPTRCGRTRPSSGCPWRSRRRSAPSTRTTSSRSWGSCAKASQSPTRCAS